MFFLILLDSREWQRSRSKANDTKKKEIKEIKEMKNGKIGSAVTIWAW
jgi:hypothetical protein